MLRYKAFRGNLMMKFDVRKFDTIDWCFLTHILEAFGFYPIFCKCIRAILESAKLYFSVNGKAVGGGVHLRGESRQDDPLSPLLFYIAEDVLSWGISLLVKKGVLQPLTGPKGTQTPSYSLFADDITVY